MISSLINILYPNACAGCQSILLFGENHICLSCHSRLPLVLWDETKGFQDLQQRFWGRVPLEYALPYLHMSRKGIVQKLLHDIKYGGNKELAELLGTWLAHQLIEKHITAFDYVLPVPLHPKKLKIRGYNQSEYFAKGISNVLGLEVRTDILLRKYFTATQTKKSKFDRWINVETVFELADKNELTGKHVLLVDDVITTGATVEACAQEILKSKPGAISIACIAIAGK